MLSIKNTVSKLNPYEANSLIEKGIGWSVNGIKEPIKDGISMTFIREYMRNMVRNVKGLNAN